VRGNQIFVNPTVSIHAQHNPGSTDRNCFSHSDDRGKVLGRRDVCTKKKLYINVYVYHIESQFGGYGPRRPDSCQTYVMGWLKG
jgi:hypothetical protein